MVRKWFGKEARVDRLKGKGETATLMSLFFLVENKVADGLAPTREDLRMRDLVMAALRELGEAGDRDAKEFVRSHSQRLERERRRAERERTPKAKRATAARPRVSYSCSSCGKPLEKIGVPSQIQALRQYGSVTDIGASGVPEEVKRDPFLYRGFVCTQCRKSFCPACSNMQGEICPSCGEQTMMPAYRPLLKKYRSKSPRT